MSGYRSDSCGSRVDRSKPVRFTFDGEKVTAFQGDTVASALLASGRRMVARSFKHHRPRGVFSAGPEEPNALVTIGSAAATEPNVKATMVPAREGLEVRSQNAWPSLANDIGALSQAIAPFISAGFYYKTFIGPVRGAWMAYEPLIRRAAGMGAGTTEPDPDRYEHANAFCDVLVVGGGAAGLAAALAAGRAGARTILVDENAVLGGAIDLEDAEIDALPVADWAAQTGAELQSLSCVRLFTRTSAYGYYDGNLIGAVEDCDEMVAGAPRKRHWRISARRVVLATGAVERPIVHAGNDRPGVMLAGSALTHLRRYGVAPGRSIAVFANNDRAWQHAASLADAGVTIAAVVDPRDTVPEVASAALKAAGAALHLGHVVANTAGGKALEAITIARHGLPDGHGESLACDALLVSGGLSPNISLASQAGGAPVYNEAILAFVPGTPREAWTACGAAAGDFDLADALKGGALAGAESANNCGIKAVAPEFQVSNHISAAGIEPLWEVPSHHGKAFVDLQHDVTAEDVRLAHREGFRSVEHLKRYTTLGMANDQGRTSNVNGLAIMAEAQGLPIPAVGTTRFRSPAEPVALGALAGRSVGAHFQPLRRTAMHEAHIAAGAEMMNVGIWQRPRHYPRPGETLEQAYVREARSVRASVGIADVSTLGKIDVQGPDAATFLDRVYTNTFSTLPVGKARYGLMLRDDGFLFDDGTTWRLSETRYLMTTTTANAGPVMAHLEFLLATAWPDLKVELTSVSEQWAGIAVSGPNSRGLLEKIVDDIDMANEALPFMGIRAGHVSGTPVLVARLSFSGELAYEIYVGAGRGAALWALLLDAGGEFECVPYGLEALGTLRIEKGHVAGPELDGRTTVHDLGLERMFSKKKPFVGKPLALRPALTDPARQQLVGLKSLNGRPIRNGAHLIARASSGPSQGHVTSMAYSPAVDGYIALALLEGGRARHGERLVAADPLRGTPVPAEVCAPCFFDPDGSRMHA